MKRAGLPVAAPSRKCAGSHRELPGKRQHGPLLGCDVQLRQNLLLLIKGSGDVDRILEIVDHRHNRTERLPIPELPANVRLK